MELKPNSTDTLHRLGWQEWEQWSADWIERVKPLKIHKDQLQQLSISINKRSPRDSFFIPAIAWGLPTGHIFWKTTGQHCLEVNFLKPQETLSPWGFRLPLKRPLTFLLLIASLWMFNLWWFYWKPTLINVWCSECVLKSWHLLSQFTLETCFHFLLSSQIF